MEPIDKLPSCLAEYYGHVFAVKSRMSLKHVFTVKSRMSLKHVFAVKSRMSLKHVFIAG